jgi:predicted NUDIX family NTP pyrophosphohydrolase
LSWLPPYWADLFGVSGTIHHDGEYTDDEDPLDVARREFGEELGRPLDTDDLTPLGEVRQSGGKIVVAWAAEGDLDPNHMESNTFTMEWPKGSGEMREFPEIDRAEWVDVDIARHKLVKGQVPLLDRLIEALAS